MIRFRMLPTALLAVFALFVPLSSIVAKEAVNRFLTGPAAGTPEQIAADYLDAQTEKLGLSVGDLAERTVSDLYASRHNGVTHVYFQQRLGGIAVVNSIINVNVMPDGRILSVGNRFVPGLTSRAGPSSPTIAPETALVRAAADLGIALGEGPLETLETPSGPSMEGRFNGAGVSYDDIPVKLEYLPLADGSVRLVWSLVIRQIGTSDWWNIFIDAVDGRALDRFNWTVHEAPAATREEQPELAPLQLPAPPDTGAPVEAALRVSGTPVEMAPRAPDSYLVIPFPNDSPFDSALTVVVDPADATASPFGWHDTDGSPGAESTLTVGNNVAAQTDIDANNAFGPPDVRPDGGPTLDFLDTADFGEQPGTYLEASVTNLFYWNNIMHDVLYHYGFDEVSGNFQENNYGNGGNGSDPVNADAQDGSGINNANFGTPPDGENPRMQMFIWTNPFSQLVTVNAGPIAGNYIANPSINGGSAMGLTADIGIAVDTSSPFNDACEPLSNDLTGKIALIVWNQGACNSSVFVNNAAAAGAIAAIIVDNTPEPFTNFGGGPSISSVAVGLDDGMLIFNEIDSGGTVNATIDDNSDPSGSLNRTSDYDNGIIAHEYGHGVSNRLTGGPAQAGCLSGNEQAGEGWSDWWSLALFADPADSATTRRPVGNYSSFRPVDSVGIRNFPYTTDMAVNPQTYEDIGSTNIPHGVGEIWASMLWEMYWLLVEKYGFDVDFYGGSGGNNLAIQLVMDGMKFQNCNPTFVDARDAILAADLANNDGANACEIWRGFAKRGLGVSAIAGSISVGDETEAFDLPESCSAIFSDAFEASATPSEKRSEPPE